MAKASRAGRIFKWLVLALLALGFAMLVFVYYLGAWNLVFPSGGHDSDPPLIPAQLESPSILVFSKTNGFRHRDGIAGGHKALAAIADRRGWSVFATENGAVFNRPDLERFDSVVFLNATGDMLNRDQQEAFRRWLERGGGWLGIHAAADGSHQFWGWYMENLIGAEFTAHILDPQFQVATVVTENPDHPVNARMPAVWDHNEEWYSWKRSPRIKGFRILAVVDEDSYSPVQKLFGNEVDLRMGDHPVVWSNCVRKGRSVYAAMGHTAEAFAQPDFRRLLENSLQWTLGLSEGGC